MILMEGGERFLTADEVAKILSVSKRTVLAMGADGRIPRIKLGHHTLRFDPADVEAYVKSVKGD